MQTGERKDPPVIKGWAENGERTKITHGEQPREDRACQLHLGRQLLLALLEAKLLDQAQPAAHSLLRGRKWLVTLPTGILKAGLHAALRKVIWKARARLQSLKEPLKKCGITPA